MKKIANLASAVANLVYTPTLLAYGWIVVHWVKAGVCLYVIALFVAYKTGAFDRFESWPVISKVVLYISGPFIILALYFSTMATTYSMLIPFFINVVLSILAGVSLRRLKSSASSEL